MIVLHAGDLPSAQTAGAADLDALGSSAHSAGHGILHGAAVRDTLFQLLSDILRHQLGVHVGVTNLDDVQLHLLADELLNGKAILLDLLAALADDHAGAGAVQENSDHVAAALDLNLGNAGTVQGLFQVLTDLLILDDQITDLLFTGIPTGIPVFDDAHTQAVGINFLSHKLLSSLMPSPSRPG